ncbi:MAG: hypothetical protein GF365_00485 [Candidatus Buchananbacteria bacterium]|nr:hypothetical protein [Candidatus Buchananbacteria bacterium]
MSPEEQKAFQRIFLQIFNQEWFDGFETSIKMDEAEMQAFGQTELDEEDYGLDGRPLNDQIIRDTYPQAKAWFLTFWDLFKVECYNNKIILERHAAKELCFTFLPREDIWEDLLDEDHEFLCFKDMKAKLKEEKDYQKAIKEKDPKEQEKIARRREIRILVRQNFIQSADSSLPQKRLAVPFAEELSQFIENLEKQGLQTTPNEIATVIKGVLPHIPLEILKLILNYQQRIANIQPYTTEQEPILELTDEYMEPLEPEIIQTSEPEIDPQTNQLIIMQREYTIGFQGLLEAFEVLAKQDHGPMEFYNKFKELLDTIHTHCQKQDKLAQYLKLVHKLQQTYMQKWDREDQTAYGLKIGFIYSGLGLKHAQLAEAMPSAFGNGSKFTCQ